MKQMQTPTAAKQWVDRFLDSRPADPNEAMGGFMVWSGALMLLGGAITVVAHIVA